MFVAFFFALGALLGADSQGYGPEALCNTLGGKYDGIVVVGGNGKEARDMKAEVPYCTAGFKEAFELVKEEVK